MTKRLFDLIVAGCVFILISPLILISAIVIKLDSPGPVFYRARRAGRDGRLFHMLKLRSMHVGLDTVDKRITAEDDDRITRSGAILRRFRLDELPQVWNVLRGDMSLVGPRPEDWDIVDRHYTAEQREVLKVRPGVASPADVRWFPDHTYHDPPPPGVPIQEYYLRRHLPVKLREERAYAEHHNLLIDIKVIWDTTCCILLHSWRPPKKREIPAFVMDAVHVQGGAD